MRLKCKTGEYELTAALQEAYAAIHPTADQEFARMYIWLESNPSRRPASAKSAPRFIQNWFKRVPKRVQTKVDQRADTVRQLLGRANVVSDFEATWADLRGQTLVRGLTQ